MTLVIEINESSKHRPTLCCRVEWRGTQMTPTVGKGRGPKELLEQAVTKGGFVDPYAEEEP